MSADLIFEEPPSQTRGPGGGVRSPIQDWLDSLRDHPGQWAKFPDRVHHAAITKIKKGHAYGASAGEFEVAGRNVSHGKGNNKIDLYARFVGTDASVTPIRSDEAGAA